MGRSEGAQALRVGTLHVAWSDHGIGSLEAENVSDGGNGRRVALPQLNVPFKLARVRDLRHLPGFLHGSVPRKLALGLRPGLMRAVPARQRILRLHVTGDLGRHTQPNLATSHLRK